MLVEAHDAADVRESSYVSAGRTSNSADRVL